MFVDSLYRQTYRFGYPVWCRLRRLMPWPVSGAHALVCYDGHVLMIRHSYRDGWWLPGGGIHRRETPIAAARRELREETGIAVDEHRLEDIGYRWRGSHSIQHIFRLDLDDPPAVAVDNREVIEARFFPVTSALRVHTHEFVRTCIALHAPRPVTMAALQD